MDISPSLVANGQPAKARQPRQRALNHPTMPAQLVLALDALARNPHLDPALGQRLPAARDVVGLVGMQLGRTLARAAAWPLDRDDGIEQVLEHPRIMGVGARQPEREGDAAALDDNMALRAWFALIRGIRSGGLAPLFAGTLALSRLARLQSSCSASPSRSSNVWCSRSQTPASCQSRKRRQQVTPLPQPSSWGSISQGMPLLSTKIMPVRAARSGTRGRPPLGLGCSGGKSGSMTFQSSSVTSGLAIMHQPYHASSYRF